MYTYPYRIGIGLVIKFKEETTHVMIYTRAYTIVDINLPFIN